VVLFNPLRNDCVFSQTSETVEDLITLECGILADWPFSQRDRVDLT